jgi:hypothetical protein
MSSNNHKRSASPSGDRDASLNKRQKRDDDKDEKNNKENQLDEKEEKKEREVKEDIKAAALPVNDPDLVVGTVDKDFVCSICFALLTDPQGSSYFLSSYLILICDLLLVAALLFIACFRIQLWSCLLSSVQ